MSAAVPRAHVAFSSAATQGHVNPMLGIVSELARRGHRVSYATTRDFAPKVEAAGATPVIYRSTLPADPDVWPRHLAEMPLWFLREAIATLPQLEAAFARDRPDIVLSEDPAGAGRLMAAKWGIPTLQVWPYFATKRHWSLNLRPDRVHPAVAEFLATLSAFLADQGVPRSATEHLVTEADGGIVLLPRSFQYLGDSFPERFRFVGPCLGGRAEQEAWPAPADDRPVLLISLGSINNDHPWFYRACVEACADLPWHVVMPVGTKFDRAGLGATPPNVHVCAQVPQLEVLSRASVFVSHAGMGGVMEALGHGVPLVTVPLLPEQVANARRVAELGLGRLLPRRSVTAAALRAAVTEAAADDGMRRRVAAMRHEIQQAGGAAAAADAIEDRLRRGA